MYVSVEVIELSKGRECALYIVLFFSYFSVKTHDVGTLWYFTPQRNASVQSHAATDQLLQTTKFGMSLGYSSKWYMSAKFPNGVGGEGFTR